MKTVLITDTHFGIKQNSITWLNSQLYFIYEQLIPYLKEQQGTRLRLIHLGDVFDSRSTISTYVASKVIEAFKELRAVVDEFIIIGGNHDYYSPNSDTIDTISLILNNLDIEIVTKEYKVKEDQLFVPWYDWQKHLEGSLNLQEVVNKFNIKRVYTHADIVHSDTKLANVDIFSGHIHIPSFKNNCFNLGSCFYLDFTDSNSDRGFYVIDNDVKLTFIKNNKSIRFWRLYNEEILSYKERSIDKKDYIELYVDQINMPNPKYSSVINEMTKKYKNIWIIPQIKNIMSDDTEDKFENYDIISMVKKMIPDDLKDKFDTILQQLND